MSGYQMDKAKFTANLLILMKLKKFMSSAMNTDISVLEISYILNQSKNPLMLEMYSKEVSNINVLDLDPIELLKKRKNSKILKVLNLVLALKIDKIKHKQEIQDYEIYIEKLLENIPTIGLDRVEQDYLKMQIQNLLTYNWDS